MNTLYTQLAQARVGNPSLGDQIKNLSGRQFFALLLPLLITIFFIAGSTLFFFSLVTGAISWITSGGDKAQVESARNKITHAVTGLVILFLSFAIVKVLENVFHISILTIDISKVNLNN
jgi:hypothetical protein